MKNTQKKLFIVTVLYLLFSILPIHVLAVENYDYGVHNDIDNPLVGTLSEKTGFRYKKINGRMYKRLWSYTQNKWLWPNWVLA